MRQRPPHPSVLANFESKLRLLVDELNREFRRPDCRASRLEGLARIIEAQVDHVAAYRALLRQANLRRAVHS